MNDSVPDVHQVLEYRADTAIVRLLPAGLGLLFLGLLGLAVLNADDRSGRDVEFILAVCVLLVVGPGIIALALFKRANRGKPIFVLSPLGIHYRIPWVKEFLIPWREIRGVDTIDITSSNWSLRNPGTMTFSDVTVILVPRPFYNARIFVDSYFLRGPGWESNFIPKGDLVQVVLHHELVSVEPRALHEAVEARWHAFRNQPSAAALPVAGEGSPKAANVPAGWRRATVRSGAPPGPGVAMGDNPKAMSTWRAVQVIAALIGIALVLTHLLGLWSWEGQTKTREGRANWDEKKTLEERREMQKGLDETDRQINEMLRRF
jgi:hypothetical protein